MINEANHNFLLLNSQVDFEVLKSHLPTELTNAELSYCKTVCHWKKNLLKSVCKTNKTYMCNSLICTVIYSLGLWSFKCRKLLRRKRIPFPHMSLSENNLSKVNLYVFMVQVKFANVLESKCTFTPYFTEYIFEGRWNNYLRNCVKWEKKL